MGHGEMQPQGSSEKGRFLKLSFYTGGEDDAEMACSLKRTAQTPISTDERWPFCWHPVMQKTSGTGGGGRPGPLYPTGWVCGLKVS